MHYEFEREQNKEWIYEKVCEELRKGGTEVIISSKNKRSDNKRILIFTGLLLNYNLFISKVPH